MYKYITEAVLYNSYNMELDRKSLNESNIERDLAEIFINRYWTLSEGDTVKIESRVIKYY